MLETTLQSDGESDCVWGCPRNGAVATERREPHPTRSCFSQLRALMEWWSRETMAELKMPNDSTAGVTRCITPVFGAMLV